MVKTRRDSHKARVGHGDSGLSKAGAAKALQGRVRCEATGMVTTGRNSNKAGVGCGDSGLSRGIIAKAHQRRVRLEGTGMVAPRAVGSVISAIITEACKYIVLAWNEIEHKSCHKRGNCIAPQAKAL